MRVTDMDIKSPEHGGNIYRASEETGFPAYELLDFSASINPLGISERVKDAIGSELDSLVHYPDPDVSELRQKIARCHNIDTGSIICGNGSTEIIYLIPRALQPERVLITAPAFSEYEKAIKISGQRSAVSDKLTENRKQIKELTLKEENGFRIIAEEFIEAMRGCDMAFLCNPNNPIGDLLRREDVLRIAEAAREAECTLVIDEAFMDFCPDHSVMGHVQENPYLIVLRSMTKFYAITGLRAGYGVFHPEIIRSINEFKEPWTVNTLAQKAAIAALDDAEYAEKTMDLIRKEKEFIENGLNELNIGFFPSAVNFYLLRTDDARRVTAEMRKKGVLVRDCSNFRGLGSGYLRIAVKDRTANEKLLKALSAVDV